MSEPLHPWWDAKRPSGFRLSPTDMLVIFLCALITWALWPVAGSTVIVLPLVLAHFFLYCNVFRAARRLEIAWAVLLLINAAAWHLAGALLLSRVFLAQVPATVIVILWTVLSKDYHGIGHTLLRRDRMTEEAVREPQENSGAAITHLPFREVVWEGRHLNMCVRGLWEYAERRAITGIVAIIPVTDDDKLVLAEQFRPPLNARVIELPAGLVGDAAGRQAESLEDAARRELLEETGYEARQLRALCRGTTSSGICDEVVTLFLATGLRKTGQGGGDETEDIALHEVPVRGLIPWLHKQEERGVLVDLKVYSALGLCRIPESE